MHDSLNYTIYSDSQIIDWKTKIKKKKKYCERENLPAHQPFYVSNLEIFIFAEAFH